MYNRRYVRHELTSEMIDEETENLLEAEVIEDEHRVKISEKGTGQFQSK